MSFTIDIDHKRKIIFYRHKGKLTFESIGQAWEQFLKLEEFTHKKYNLISDYREGEFHMKIEEINGIVNYLRQIESIVKGKRQSLIMKDAFSTAGAILLEEEVTRELGFNTRVFSTEEAALEWAMK